jgi:amidohydrolase
MSNPADGIAGILGELKAWRHELHAHPETAFEEHQTAAFVAAKLTSFGLEVHQGLAGTGVIGVLAHGDGPMIGLRADMDALHVEEAGNVPYRSQHPGRMHACGHDGHTTMLLGAARLLSQNRAFRGTIVFIFQPAEENEGGARVMVEEGLFEKFPMQSVYGLHNRPGMPLGKMAICAGPLMAALDIFELTVHGKGAHAAMPHMGLDPIVIAAQIVGAWQTIASRNVDPIDASVVSVTQFHAGDTWNVIPASAVLRGTTRSFRDETQDLIEKRMRDIANHLCAAFDVRCDLRYERRYPVTVNTPQEARLAHTAAAAVIGAGNIDEHPTPSTGSEDFAFMLRQRPGCYVWLGNGPADEGRNLHSPHYDFNDDAMPTGVSYWVSLVQTLLPE